MIKTIGLIYLALMLSLGVMLGGTAFYLYECNVLYFFFSLGVYLLCGVTILIVNSVTKNIMFSLFMLTLKSDLSNFIKGFKLSVTKFFINIIS